MATKSFLTQSQLDRARKKFLKVELPSARKSFSVPEVAELSYWLGDQLLKKLSGDPEMWQASQPIALGSWARNELCPRSDIDLLFVGEESAASSLIQKLQEEGLPIRSRLPENSSNWSIGVEEFDVLALLKARAFSPEGEKQLANQLETLLPRTKKLSRKLLKSMVVERKERSQRNDSMTNYLEPNLKYGPGGLRDLGQASSCWALVPKKFENSAKIVKRLGQFNEFLLAIRQRLHLLGYQDTLVAEAQLELSKCFGFLNVQEFMSEVQYVLSEVAFYTDWTLEKALQRTMTELPKKWSLNSALSFLSIKPNTLHEEAIRSADISLPAKKNIGRLLNRHWVQLGSEVCVRAAFRARIPHRIFPELKRVTGLVQHDQYHRYSVDAHSLQVMREVHRLRKNPGHLGKRLKEKVKALGSRDWEILLWTAFYHDLCKGRQGDHSVEGEKLVKREMTHLGFSLRTIVEVAWMVRNHLVMSQAAFRKNPREPSTWQWLFDQGVRKRRIYNLGLFTALDIRGTNPDAWNEWKEDLLSELIENLHSPKAEKYLNIIERYEKQGLQVDNDFFNALDPRLIEKLPGRILSEDAFHLKTAKKPAKPIVVAESNRRFWIRFHWPQDEDGLFLRFVHALHSAGGSVSEAYIQTLGQQGVYDWFRISSSASRGQLQKLLKSLLEAELDPNWPQPQFDKISVVEHRGGEAIISFRGKDQRGALMGAAHALYQAGLPIVWAKVNTWGRQLDDVFAVRTDEKKLKSFLEGPAKDLLAK